MLQHVGALGALTRLPGSPGSPFSPFCPPEGPCKDKYMLYQRVWLLDPGGSSSCDISRQVLTGGPGYPGSPRGPGAPGSP